SLAVDFGYEALSDIPRVTRPKPRPAAKPYSRGARTLQGYPRRIFLAEGNWQRVEPPEKIVSCYQWRSAAAQRVLTGVPGKHGKSQRAWGFFPGSSQLLTTKVTTATDGN